MNVLSLYCPKSSYSQTPHRRICKIPTVSHSTYNVHTAVSIISLDLQLCGELRRRDPSNTGLKEIKALLSRWKELRSTGIPYLCTDPTFESRTHPHSCWELWDRCSADAQALIYPESKGSIQRRVSWWGMDVVCKFSSSQRHKTVLTVTNTAQHKD